MHEKAINYCVKITLKTLDDIRVCNGCTRASCEDPRVGPLLPQSQVVWKENHEEVLHRGWYGG